MSISISDRHVPDLQLVINYLKNTLHYKNVIIAGHSEGSLAQLKGISSKEDRKKIIKEVLEVTNLWDVRNKSVSGYSGGMKQRFGIAQLLLNNPKLF